MMLKTWLGRPGHAFLWKGGMCLDEGSGRSLDFAYNDNPSTQIHDSGICLIFRKNQTNFRARIALGSSSTGDFSNYPHTFRFAQQSSVRQRKFIPFVLTYSIVFVYTDNSSELCLREHYKRKLMNTDDKEPKKNAEVRGYANLLCDFMFKRVFGSEANKDMLIEFLNMVLEDIRIEHVDFTPNEHQGLTEEDRKVVFDISCRCSDGRTFIIEMQNGFQRHFRKRAIYYTTYPINAQGREAREFYFKEKEEGKTDAKFNWDYNLNPVIVVAILNFRFEHGQEWPSERFRKRVWELETIPENFTEPLFKRLFLLSELGKFTAEEYEHYIKSMDNMGDYDNIIQTAAEDAHARGLAEGEAKGLEKGREEGSMAKAFEMARNLKTLGVEISVIVQASGLTEEQVAAL